MSSESGEDTEECGSVDGSQADDEEDDMGLPFVSLSGDVSVEALLRQVRPDPEKGVQIIGQSIRDLMPIIEFARRRQTEVDCELDGLDVIYDYFRTEQVTVMIRYQQVLEIEITDREGVFLDEFIAYLDSDDAEDDDSLYRGDGFDIEHDSGDDELKVCFDKAAVLSQEEALEWVDQLPQYRILVSRPTRLVNHPRISGYCIDFNSITVERGVLVAKLGDMQGVEFLQTLPDRPKIVKLPNRLPDEECWDSVMRLANVIEFVGYDIPMSIQKYRFPITLDGDAARWRSLDKSSYPSFRGMRIDEFPVAVKEGILLLVDPGIGRMDALKRVNPKVCNGFPYHEVRVGLCDLGPNAQALIEENDQLWYTYVPDREEALARMILGVSRIDGVQWFNSHVNCPPELRETYLGIRARRAQQLR